MHTLQNITVVLLLILPFKLFSQIEDDTVKYYGIIGGSIIYESIELYPNNEFKWTSEFDLSWDEFGFYEIDGKKLILRFYNAFTNEGLYEKRENKQFYKKEIFEIEENKLYRLDENGNRIKRKRDRYIKSKWSWLFGHRHKYEIIRN